MLKDLKHTIRQSAVYGLSRISTKLIAFVLLPLYSVYFSVGEYGVISRTETFWQILWAIFLFGLESGIIRWYSKFQNPEDKKKFLFSVTIFLLILNFIFAVFFYFTSGFFSTLIFETADYSRLIFYASLVASGETFIFVIFLLLRINEKAFLYTLYATLISVLNLGIQVYFILYTNNKLEGIFIAKILSSFIVIAFLLPYYLKYLKPGIQVKVLKELLIYSFPIMFSGIAGILLNQSDRFILGYLGTSDEVGLYSLAYNISGILNFLVIVPFSLAFTVISWKKLGDENAARFFTKTVTYLFFAVTYLGLMLSLSIPQLIKIFTLRDAYWGASNVVPWIAIAMPFYGISIIGFFSFYVTQKTSYVLYFNVAALIVNVTLNFIFIPRFGMYAAAVSNFVAFAFLCVLNYYFSRKNYFFKYEWMKVLLMIAVYVILLIPFFYFHINNIFVNILLKLTAIFLFPVILYFLNFYEPVELDRIKGFFKKYLHIRMK